LHPLMLPDDVTCFWPVLPRQRAWAAPRQPEHTHLEGNHGEVRWNP
jgi:hypothetical protein